MPTPVQVDPAPSAVPSLLRTLIPVVVGYLASQPLVEVLGLGDDHVTALVTAVTTAAYYLVVRVVERYVPAAGWLIGYASRPAYLPPSAVAGGAVLVSARTPGPQ